MSEFIINDNGFNRPMTEDEINAYLENKAFCDDYEIHLQAAIAAKESAKAKLAALGLTEAEVNAIIGGV